MLAITLTLHPLFAQMDVYVTCLHKLETGNVNIMNPIAFFEQPSSLAHNPLPFFKPMDIISWNVRGAASTDFRRVFREMVNYLKPGIVILTETRLSGDKENSMISTLGFEGHLKVDAMGFSSGIWVLRHPFAILVEPISNAFHEMFFKVQVNAKIFILTAIYDSPEFSIRKLFWNR